MTVTSTARRARRGVALALLALSLLPAHRLLGSRSGPAGAATAATADALLELTWLGTVVVLGAALALGLVAPVRRFEQGLQKARAGLLALPPFWFAVGLFTVGLALATTTALGLHRGLPRLLDEMAQLLHARYFAWGRLAGDLPAPEAARLIQNSLVVDAGWVSVYPPGHTALLALGLVLDVGWLVGPALFAVTGPFTYLALQGLYRDREATARLAGLAVTMSPFMVLLGSGYLSHTSAGAAAAAAFYFAVLAWRGSAWWGALAGLAAGFMITSRPLSGVVLGGFLTAGVWTGFWWREGRAVGWLGRRIVGAALGALPFLVALAAYNRTLFGGVVRFGYEAAFGPAHGLGFHRDPWGNEYGLLEAVGYTGSDLATLGLQLLETPVSAVALVAVFLLVVPRLSPGTAALAGWALVAVAANALYWHHGYHMGPRMLYEAAPAWAALSAVAAVGLVAGGRDPGEPGRPERVWSTRYLGATAFWVVALALAGGVGLLLPSRVQAYRWGEAGLLASTPPDVLPHEPTLLFVHGPWASRLSSRLVSAGMRRDSVETALRRNDICRVHLYAEARLAGRSPLPPLDLAPRPGTPPRLRLVEVAPGVQVRVDPAVVAPPACLRELRSDRLGVLELAPLLWQTSLPEEEGPLLVVRDLGPEENRAILDRYPERVPYIYAPAGTDQRPALVGYERGVELMWRGGGTQPDPGGARIGQRSGVR